MSYAKTFISMSPQSYQAGRRLVLFAAMLMSGGALFFPRTAILLVIAVMCGALAGPSLGLRRGMWAIGLLLFAVFCVSIFQIYDQDFVPIIVRYANFIAGLLLLGMYWKLSPKTFALDINPILRLMGFQAVITVFLYVATPNLFTIITAEETVYRSILGVFNYHGTQGAIVRPDGFFFEPGVFQIYMNIFLFISLFVTRRKFDVLLALASLSAIRSTTGMIITGVLLSAAYFGWFLKSSPTERLFSALAAPIFVFAILLTVGGNIEDKLSGESRGSSWAREYDFRTGVNIVREHALTGIGFDNDRYKYEARKLGYDGGNLDYDTTENRSSSNGLVMLVVALGIPLSLPFIIGLFRQRFFPRPILFGSLLVLSFAGEALMFTPFFLMLMFSGLLGIRRRKPASTPRCPAPPPPGVARA